LKIASRNLSCGKDPLDGRKEGGDNPEARREGNEDAISENNGERLV